MKQLFFSFFFLFDHIGIILHIWGTSISVLLLENTGSGKVHNNNIIIILAFSHSENHAG
jgi:hypothetical protein